MTIKKVKLLLKTVNFLKPIQIGYRLYYFIRARWRKLTGFRYPLVLASTSRALILQPSITSYVFVDEDKFTFLNLSHTFRNKIDWNYDNYGKLWTYNLTYFEFLHQPEMSREAGLTLISDFIEQRDGLKDGLEPFPISLRGINWIKFFTLHNVRDQKIDDSLHAQYDILMDKLEYHLLGNHLLENGFSLLFGAYYFTNEKLYAKAKEILTTELEEQILDDGAHFELSPMYHQIMLYRVLDCINLVKNNDYQQQELLSLLEEKADQMLGWLNVISYKNGEIPLLNDSAKGIAPTTKQLNHYAGSLGVDISESNIELKESGYRKYQRERYECVIDVGQIGPDYIPGHAHADTFSFEVHMDQKPFIVDTGLSTYEANTRRKIERGTTSHNTVEIYGTDSSEVWGGFRVANRAYVTKLEESATKVVASHDGYQQKFGITHTREWQFEDEKIVIKDSLSKTAKAVARLHFHPDVTEEMIKKHIIINQSSIANYHYAPEFNTLIDANVLEMTFNDELEITIKI